MLYLYPCIEQLDRAAEELRYGNAIHSRLALIMIDNVVELVCYRKYQSLLEEDHWRQATEYHPSKSGKQILHTPRFLDVLSFLVKREEISNDERMLASIAHEYRNAAYHVGLTLDDAVHPATWHYHGLACELFGRLNPWHFSYRPDDPITARVRKHLNTVALREYEDYLQTILGIGPVRGRLKMYLIFLKKLELRLSPHVDDIEPEEGLRELARSLAKERPTLEKPMEHVLAHSIGSRVDEIDYEVRFLTSSPRLPYDWRWLVSRISPPNDTDWVSHLAALPIARWRDRVAHLKNEHEPARALQKYNSIIDDLTRYAEKIRPTAEYLAEFLDWEINIIKKRTWSG